ncbi:GDSL-type esterase/lipase family protein [Mucilaginibacter terrae]|uniref:GDSL-type esterase/lipase family protein n=1 Tax=Mucilaginibacter terrae TaxID=1955052 RepID=UPI00362F7ED6
MKHLKPLFTLALLLLICSAGFSQIRVACIGTGLIKVQDGVHIADSLSYPAQLQKKLGSSYAVLNYTVSGATVVSKGGRSYRDEKVYQQAMASKPNVVLMEFGIEDSKPINRIHLDEFLKDYRELIHSFKAVSPKARIILLLPPPSFKPDTADVWDRVLTGKISPLIQKLAYEDQLEVISLRLPLIDQPTLFRDLIHPNAQGITIIATRLNELLSAQHTGALSFFAGIAPSPHISSFYGYACTDFKFQGRDCKVVQPKWSAVGHPWIWRARFWNTEPQTDVALLERGYHLVYCDVAELYGNSKAINIWNDFYDLMQQAGLCKKVVLEGMSRGGVYVYNWAAENPEKVACVYADNPVLNLKSWPGGKGKGPGSKKDWELVKVDYNLISTLDEDRFSESPLDKVGKIVKGRYPMLHVLADADEVVPPDENTIPFEQQVKSLGGTITVIHKPGFKHHPHSLTNPAPIVNFIINVVSKPIQ